MIVGAGAALVVLALMMVLYFLEAELAVWMLIVFPVAAFVICFLPALFIVGALVKEKIAPFEYTLNSTKAEESSSIVDSPDKEIKEKASDNVKGVAAVSYTHLRAHET